MNAILFALNVIALAALVTLHLNTDRNDMALVQADTQHWVARPVAQRAVMDTQHIRASMVRSQSPAAQGELDGMEMGQPAPVERYVF
ncbi:MULTISPECIES: hypothetical protein [unclassified Pseudomonas]|uniref:hypothetical protein n=1 Tax=unclassified Pseudomonas TaxID=196821 RepID=UPI000BD03810|nr:MULTISPECIES: hypothetical protein [unclassified Pseudomonas]PVZ13759.1 hypothetical protein F474_02843 [Pseudomonas sp. URIL14HWK12:I12]PVZ24065.1 hypothetical protein F470_02498 [Pseudomonas sp. URIL14HWK12:I10]PVZ33296.1 hypothetical protein F472_02764 [Pseudomonas sp. URIL14HWK12:I11]SNZ11050.1 hypothetical protein SAMN05660463_01749 [Pseudomonas sp. URIL14HWK12:I9]